MSNYSMQKVDYEQFTINEKYQNAVPRPNEYEYNALKMKIIENGQQEPIIVNKNMVILDGHTRYDIMSQRGMEIEYRTKDFDDEEQEFEYVVESNIMRRQLNNFQKLETLYGLYRDKKEEKNYNGWISIMESIKKGNNTRNMIAGDINYSEPAVGKILSQMLNQYYVRKEKKFRLHGDGLSGGTTFYEFTLLPKSEEFLSKNTRKEKGGATMMISKITGLNRNTVSKGMLLIERVDYKTKKKLRDGVLSINGVYEDITKRKRAKSTYKNTWSKYAKIKCPHCKHISQKDEFEVIKRR